MIDISKLDKAAVLAALYNASKPQGRGALMFEAQPMTVEQASETLRSIEAHPVRGQYIDYLRGRVMKLNLTDELDVRLYDRDNGEGAALRALTPLLEAVA